MTRNIPLLYLHKFLIYFAPYSAFLVIYFNQVAGSYTAAMLVTAVGALASAFLDIPTGVFSDRMGRRRTIALGSFFYVLGLSCYAFAHGLPLLLTGAVLLGMGRCLFNGNNTALLYESLRTTDGTHLFAHHHGRIGTIFQLSLAISALCGGLLALVNLRAIFLVSIVPVALAFPLCFFLQEPEIHVTRQTKDMAHLYEACRLVLRSRKLFLLILGQALSKAISDTTFSFKPALVSLIWPTWLAGFYRAGSQTLGAISFWFANQIIQKVRPARVLVLSQIYWFVTQGLAVLLMNEASPLLMVVENVPYGPYSVAVDLMLQNEFTDAQRATLGSLASFSTSIFYALSSLAIGYVADEWGLQAGIGFGIILNGLTLPIFLTLARRHF